MVCSGSVRPCDLPLHLGDVGQFSGSSESRQTGKRRLQAEPNPSLRYRGQILGGPPGSVMTVESALISHDSGPQDGPTLRAKGIDGLQPVGYVFRVAPGGGLHRRPDCAASSYGAGTVVPTTGRCSMPTNRCGRGSVLDRVPPELRSFLGAIELKLSQADERHLRAEGRLRQSRWLRLKIAEMEDCLEQLGLPRGCWRQLWVPGLHDEEPDPDARSIRRLSPVPGDRAPTAGTALG